MLCGEGGIHISRKHSFEKKIGFFILVPCKESNSSKFKMYDKRNCAIFCVIHFRPYLELSKGHKFSKANFGVFNFSKKQTKGFCPNDVKLVK